MSSPLQPPPPIANGDPRLAEFDRFMLLLWRKNQELEARIATLEGE